jgi:signal transduction histidine kinase
MRDPAYILLAFLGVANTIRNRLFLSFGLLMLLVVSFLGLSFYILLRIQKINALNREVSHLESSVLKMRVAVGRFLEEDIHNVEYYQKGVTVNTLEIDSLDVEIDRMVNVASVLSAQLDFQLSSELNTVRDALNIYRLQLAELKVKVTRLGFKDYGFEGMMREVIHDMEHRQMLAEQVYLAIRRNEKDFIMRGEEQYADNVMKLSLNAWATLHRVGDTAATNRLAKYREVFSNYVAVYNDIYDRKTGVRRRLTRAGTNSLEACASFTGLVESMSTREMTGLKINIIVASIVGLLLGFAISFLVGQNLSNPLRRLTIHMDGYFIQNRRDVLQMPHDKVPKEIGVVAKSFERLTAQIESQISEISEQNHRLEQQNSELKKLNTEMDRFIYHTSHDLRSPLTSIIGLVELIRMEGPERAEEYLTHIDTSVQRLDATIKEIIHFYRNRNTPSLREPFSMNLLFSEVCQQYKFATAARDISFVGNFPQDFVMLDKYRLRIILGNLISNSVKYHDTLKQHRYVKCETLKSKNDLLIIVSDNGQGIESTEIPRVFNMFYRATDQSQGSGLGLFIVQESVERMQGNIAIESKIGVGTSITLTLPDYYIQIGEKAATAGELLLA